MRKRRTFFKVIALCLIMTFLTSSICFAEGTVSTSTANSDVSAQVAEISKSLTSNGKFVPYQEVYQYDKQKRVIKYIKITADTEEITSYEYKADGTRTETKTTQKIANTTPTVKSSGVSVQAMSGDELIYDDRIKQRLNAAGQTYSSAEMYYQMGTYSLDQKEEIQKQAHQEADIARADYILMYPYSDYAYAKLGGSKSTDLPLSRELYNDEGSQLTGLDITVIQRGLELLEKFELPAGQDYGTYGPATETAVNDYQQNNMHITPTGHVWKQTYSSLLGAATTSKRTYNWINMLNIFRLRHNMAGRLFAAEVGGVTDVTIPGGGLLRGSCGYADIVNKLDRRVWEVKPDNTNWNEADLSKKGTKQLQRYITASLTIDPVKYPDTASFCPLIAGYDIPNVITVPYNNDEEMIVRSGRPTLSNPDPLLTGMVYYKVQKKKKQEQEETQPQEGIATQTAPSEDGVKTALTWAGIGAGALIVFHVAKGVVAIVAAPETGGASLLLLAAG